MEEKLTKLVSITSIPAIIIIFYLQLQSIQQQIQNTEELAKSVEELQKSITAHCHILTQSQVPLR